MIKIVVIYYIPKSAGEKYRVWTDGFTRALEILKNKYQITLYNSFEDHQINFEEYDIIFFKESFQGNMYRKYSSKIKNKKLGLFISSSRLIPTNEEIKLYDLIFYETTWYYNFANLERHKNVHHAFGINKDIMKPIKTKKKYDVIFIGNIAEEKRPLNILDIKGKKICFGFKSDKIITKILEEKGVEVNDFIPYHKLAKYYNESKLCYIPCSLHGGGERAVLEARACGIPVKIEADNSKLQELVNGDIFSSEYYAKQIDYGIQQTFLYLH